MPAYTEALEAALGRVVADMRRDAAAAQDRVALLMAQAEARLAEHQARCGALEAEMRGVVAERLAQVRDGDPGAPGKDGRDGEDGRDGLNGERGKDGVDGRDGDPGAPGKDGKDGVNGEPGRDGQDGEPGPEGRLPAVKAWEDRVHYAGAVVTHCGATWQASADTGRPPPADDWVCLAAAGDPGQDGAHGKDGAGFALRGTFDPEAAYLAGDVVALNGSSFVARTDEPGPCPGGGWQLWASRGSRGAAGDSGVRGEKGDRGDPGQPGKDGRDAAAPVALVLGDDGRLVLTMSDGAEVTADLYPLLTRAAR